MDRMSQHRVIGIVVIVAVVIILSQYVIANRQDEVFPKALPVEPQALQPQHIPQMDAPKTAKTTAEESVAVETSPSKVKESKPSQAVVATPAPKVEPPKAPRHAWALQLGIFGNHASVETMVQTLADAGISSKVIPTQLNGKSVEKVMAALCLDKASVLQAKENIDKLFKVSTAVVSYTCQEGE